jgi:DNA-binding transcriptional ArsR family regulator
MIDRLVHEPARLSILTNLYLVERADATWLMQQTGLTWGNLATHLQKLEEAGLVVAIKRFKGRKPQTMLHLTDEGRDALLAYRSAMLDTLGKLEPRSADQ